MDNHLKVLCTICARGGSMGVKNKNLVQLRSKPLIAHTILQAQKSKLFSAIAVSSDSETIRSVAGKWGVDYLIERPQEMATSTAAKLPVIQHALLEAERLSSQQFDVVMDLDVTSPLRSVEDLAESYRQFMDNPTAFNLVSGFPARRSPYFNLLEMGEDGFVRLAKKTDKPIVRRQDTPPYYDMNASIYIWRRHTLLDSKTTINPRTIIYLMPEERSIDIDSAIDLKLVRLLAKNRKDL